MSEKCTYCVECRIMDMNVKEYSPCFWEQPVFDFIKVYLMRSVRS